MKWITATSLFAMATIAVAQQTQNQYEPHNAAGAGQKLLAQLTGDWEVVKTFFPSNGKQIVTNGTCKQYMVQDGKFLQSDFTSGQVLKTLPSAWPEASHHGGGSLNAHRSVVHC
jgi:hypothetical protein